MKPEELGAPPLSVSTHEIIRLRRLVERQEKQIACLLDALTEIASTKLNVPNHNTPTARTLRFVRMQSLARTALESVGRIEVAQ